MSRTSYPGAAARGLAAGVVGTALMTAYQLAVRKARGQRLDTPVPRTWADAPAPAQVAKKVAELAGRPRAVTKQDVPRVATAVHWAYGLGWGVAYGLAARALGLRPLTGAAGFGVALWGASYAELVPLGISEPPWRYPLGELGLDLSYHVVYGAGVAAAYSMLDD